LPPLPGATISCRSQKCRKAKCRIYFIPPESTKCGLVASRRC
jgi:hypothetical protein